MSDYGVRTKSLYEIIDEVNSNKASSGGPAPAQEDHIGKGAVGAANLAIAVSNIKPPLDTLAT